MTTTTSLYGTCEQLFAGYPLAVRNVNPGGTVRCMTIMLEGEATFYVLVHHAKDGDDFYSLLHWSGGEIAEIGTDSEPPAVGEVGDILTHAVPLPRDGSMFGWLDRSEVTALILVYVQADDENPDPTWSPMARTDAPQRLPFADERLFGRWFWDYCRCGQMVDLSGLVAGTQDTVFWVETPQIPGSGVGSVAVAEDVRHRGFVLRCGLYVYHTALAAAREIPSLDDVLAGPSKMDLAPQFQQ